MNDYSDEATAQWIENSGLLDASVVQSYQKVHRLSYGEILAISSELFLKAKKNKADEGILLQGFRPYYFYSFILNQFEELHGRISKFH